MHRRLRVMPTGMTNPMAPALPIVHADVKGVLPTLDRWLRHDDKWLVLSAILHQHKCKAHTDTDRRARCCLARADHPDLFVRKAIGWAVRPYSYEDPGWGEHWVGAVNG